MATTYINGELVKSIGLVDEDNAKSAVVEYYNSDENNKDKITEDDVFVWLFDEKVGFIMGVGNRKKIYFVTFFDWELYIEEFERKGNDYYSFYYEDEYEDE